MSNEERIVLNISKLTPDLAVYAKSVGNGDDNLTVAEQKELEQKLNGNQALKNALLANESDDVKALFGFTTSSSTTEAAAVTAPKAEPSKEAKKLIAKVAVYDAFEEARGYDEKTGRYSKTMKQAYNEIKDKFSDKKRFPDKALRKEFAKALKELKQDAKHGAIGIETATDARRSALAVDDNNNVVNKKALTYTTVKDVRNAEIDALTTTNGDVDTWAKRLLRQHDGTLARRIVNWFSGNNSAGKDDDINVAHANNAAGKRLTKHSETELKANFGTELFETLKRFNLISEKNGQYDVTDFSVIVGNSIGDATFNEHDIEVESEKQSIKNKLHNAIFDKIVEEQMAKGKSYNEANYIAYRTPFNIADLDKDQIRNIVKTLGYYDDTARKKAVRVYQHAMQGLVGGAFGGAAGGSVQAYKLFQGQLITYDETMTDEELIGLIKSGKAPEFVLENDGILNQQLMERSVLTSIGLGAAVGAIAGLAAGVLQGLASEGREVEVIGLTTECEMTREKLLSLIDKAYSDKDISPEIKHAIKQIVALGYVTEKAVDPETGKTYERFVLDDECQPVWDYCQFWKKYNNLRGNQIFNAPETRFAALRLQNRATKIEDVVLEDCPQTNTCPKPMIRQDKTPSKTYDINHIKFRAWNDLVNGYDCLKAKEYQKSYKVGNGHTTLANRMVKVIQAIKVDGVKTEDELKKLYNIETIAAFADEAIKHGIDSAMAKFPGLPIDKAEYLTAVTSKGGIKGNVYVPPLYDPKAAANGEDGFCNWNKKKPVAINRNGNGSAGSIGNKQAHTEEKTESFESCDNGKNWNAITNEEYDKLAKDPNVTIVE